MAKKNLLIIVILIVAVIIAVFAFGNKADNNQEATPGSQIPVPGNTIFYTDSGFSPNPLTVKLGETVTFINQSSNPFWPASPMHPTHKVYPGSDIERCGTAEEPNIFDACRGIPAGGSWSFTFDEIGSWNYHNHLNSSHFGKIVVE